MSIFIGEVPAISYLIVVVQSDGLEVLQFPQIPQFQRAILGTWSTAPDIDVRVFQTITYTVPDPFSAKTRAEDASSVFKIL